MVSGCLNRSNFKLVSCEFQFLIQAPIFYNPAPALLCRLKFADLNLVHTILVMFVITDDKIPQY